MKKQGILRKYSWKSPISNGLFIGAFRIGSKYSVLLFGFMSMQFRSFMKGMAHPIFCRQTIYSQSLVLDGAHLKKKACRHTHGIFVDLSRIFILGYSVKNRQGILTSYRPRSFLLDIPCSNGNRNYLLIHYKANVK